MFSFRWSIRDLMWSKGKKKSSPGGYTDTVYRSRQTRGFESKSRCCCFYFTRSVSLPSKSYLCLVRAVSGARDEHANAVDDHFCPTYGVGVAAVDVNTPDSKDTCNSQLGAAPCNKRKQALGIEGPLALGPRQRLKAPPCRCFCCSYLPF